MTQSGSSDESTVLARARKSAPAICTRARARGRSGDMFNLYATPRLVEVFRDQTAVTMVRRFFATKKAPAVKKIAWRGFLYAPGAHQIEELSFVVRPVAVFLLLVRVKNFGCWSKLRHVHIFDAADCLREVPEIIPLGESGKLRDVVQAHVQ